MYLAGYSPTAPVVTKESVVTVTKKKADSSNLSLGINAFESGMYTAAFDYFSKAEKADKSAEASYYLGLLYEKGLGVKQSESKARSEYKKAMKEDHPDALYHFAVMQIRAQKDDGFPFLERAALHGSLEALREMGCYYYFGFQQGSARYNKDYNRALDFFQKSAEMGDSASMRYVGLCYFYRDSDYDRAFEWFKKAENAEILGETRAIWITNFTDGKYNNWTLNEPNKADLFEDLGNCYYCGWGTSADDSAAHRYYRDSAALRTDAEALNDEANDAVNADNPNYTKGFEFFLRSANLGNLIATSNMGWCYRWGHGVAKDGAKAVEWWEKAASQGDAYSQNNLGYMYRDGTGVPQDFKKAFDWFYKAALQENASSQVEVGFMYEKGNGVDKDMSKAFYWYEKSARNGDKVGQFDVAVMYENGTGTAKDLQKALEWYKKSAAQGYESAQKALTRLGSSASATVPSSDWLFPIFGLELGKSTESQVKAKSEKKFNDDHGYYVNGHLFECRKNGTLYWVQFFDNSSRPWPQELVSKGYNPNYTYEQWKSFLIQQGYTITRYTTSEKIDAEKNTPIKHDLSVSFNKNGTTGSLRLNIN